MPSEKFIDKLGRSIDIEFDEDILTCVARDNGKLLGTFQFREADPDKDSCLLLLTHCHIEEAPGYKRCGIGEQLLRLPVEYGYLIFARSHDGIRLEDGSHLTEDAPAFIDAMVKKGLVKQLGSAAEHHNYDD